MSKFKKKIFWLPGIMESNCSEPRVKPKVDGIFRMMVSVVVWGNLP